MTLANYHTHTTFCDGKNTPEEVVKAAIDEGLDILGFSAHAYTPYDLRYCMKDSVGYIKEISRLRKEYEGQIEILLGIEEDSFKIHNRADFDYIIGSSHYTVRGGEYYPIDSSEDRFKTCIEVWDGNYLAFAEDYFSRFTDYVKKWRPDMIGHFDLITKFDDTLDIRLGENPEYNRIAEKYTRVALEAECVFEVNTGAITRGYRKTPYPYENLLHLIKKEGGRVILNSDSHSKDTLTCYFNEARALLRDVGFKKVQILTRSGFREESI